jgi:hypothetical protein
MAGRIEKERGMVFHLVWRKAMRRRFDERQIVREMLTTWGEWERLGLYQEGVVRSVLGRLMRDGPGVPCSAPGPSVPMGVLIPGEVTTAGRLVARMREEAPAGERWCSVIRDKYVVGNAGAAPDAVGRAVDWMARAWVDDVAAARRLPGLAEALGAGVSGRRVRPRDDEVGAVAADVAEGA